MNIAVDTNVLVRAILADDPEQGRSARKLLTDATTIAVPLPCLCELVWILRRGAKLATADIAGAIRALVNTGNVAMNRPAVEAGLRLLEAGGDFADGVIAYEGRWLGGETFISFDRKAVALLSQQGEAAQLLS
ncbi:type II toxin-antitoxin system VapC family toxin [Methylobacterium sp. J-072]|uniref:type II toxin-antitoxin system VapC family toxin n=1 Tax=Methylobacterium sp. J-072 TaxID=2836651 RepID=UPI001FB9A80B|nr:type II toxin-antitoxin system VapC family toxin [Methylobacterium sp. J-072]MCJ2095054.1 type II toxin-antitoxin system VapC family toxin [Methylobacterium sp. J-072]